MSFAWAFDPMLLAGKKILVTGVLTRRSIAFTVAARAQENGAEILLTGFGRTRRLTERTARRLEPSPDVLELDVRSEEDLEAVASELMSRWHGLDGVLHSVAYAPPDALGGQFLTAPTQSALEALEVSAVSLRSLSRALKPLFEMRGGGSIVGLDFDASRAWPGYDWMGVAKAGLEAVNRYLAAYLGPLGVRSNLIAAGPLHTEAASGIPAYELMANDWNRLAPLGWDASDSTPVADAACFLLSDRARAITGEILHVDGGRHAIGSITPDALHVGRPADATESLRVENADA